MRQLLIYLLLGPYLATGQIDSLDIKIGQMILMGLDNFNRLDKTEIFFRDVKNGKVGNVILFEKQINPKKPIKDLRKINNYLQQIAPIPMLIAIDEEGGRVNRLKPKYGFPKILSAEKIGKLPEDSIRYYARTSGSTMAKLGFNLNFAPVLDVNINPENPVIGKIERSYSKNFSEVSRIAGIVIEEQSNQGIINCVKHFPGHGSSNQDSHYGLTDVTGTWQIEELFPYRDLIKEGKIKMIMTAHIVNSQLDKSRLPATLSKKVITELLRKFMNYKGVVISDAMEMRAISRNFGVEESIVLAINAGVDMLIFGNNGSLADDIRPDKIHAIIKKNVNNGNISRERIEESFHRIMKLKTLLK